MERNPKRSGTRENRAKSSRTAQRSGPRENRATNSRTCACSTVWRNKVKMKERWVTNYELLEWWWWLLPKGDKSGDPGAQIKLESSVSSLGRLAMRRFEPSFLWRYRIISFEAWLGAPSEQTLAMKQRNSWVTFSFRNKYSKTGKWNNFETVDSLPISACCQMKSDCMYPGSLCSIRSHSFMRHFL